MNANVISVGTKVELELLNSLGSKIGRAYTGEFVEIVSEMEVIIFSTEQWPGPLNSSESIRIRALFTHPLHGLLKFEGILTRKEETKSGIKFHIRIDDAFSEIQKREYFRPTCITKAEYRLVKELNDNNEEPAQEIPYKIVKTRNISFDGVCILLDKTDDISKNDLVDLIVWLKNDLSIKMRCEVIRINEYKINGKNNYELGLSIEDINDDDRALLTEYITKSAMANSLYWGETPSFD